jgi:hypothetical protein
MFFVKNLAAAGDSPPSVEAFQKNHYEDKI